jgi:NADPH-dependent ferric siderophore reductase
VWVTDAEIGEAIEGLGPVRGTAAYVNGERHLVVHVVDLLIAAGVDPGDVTSKAYWRRDQPNEDRGEPRRV